MNIIKYYKVCKLVSNKVGNQNIGIAINRFYMHCNLITYSSKLQYFLLSCNRNGSIPFITLFVYDKLLSPSLVS